jgi:hypothetical protein
VRGVHRAGGLADPGHPVDRADAHHPAVRRYGGQRPHQPRQLGLAACERGDIPRQAPGRRDEKPARRLGQAQRAGQQQRGVPAGVAWMPRSRSLTDRGDRPAASASSSWVSLASARSCRSNPANPCPGSATAPTPYNLARARGARTRPMLKAYADPITRATPPAPASPGQQDPARRVPAVPVRAWVGCLASEPVYVGCCVGGRVW